MEREGKGRMKKIRYRLLRIGMCALLCAFFALFASIHANASALDSSGQNGGDIYQEQLDQSGADELVDELPGEARSLLDDLGVDSPDWQAISDLSAGQIFSQLGQIAQEQSGGPLKAMLQVVAVMLFCALLEGMKRSLGDRPLSGMVGVVGALCVCLIIVAPIVDCVQSSVQIIEGAAAFMLCYIPVLAGLMIAGGQGISAASFHLLMVGAGEVITLVSSGVLAPLLNAFLALSITSSVSPRLHLQHICDLLYKGVKWLLGITMTIFIAILTTQTIIGTAADSAGTKAVKFAISNFVPLVGGALSDALNTVQGSIRLIKTGVGAFGILAAGVIFVPVLVRCLLWMATTSLCACVGDLFELGQLAGLLRAAGKVLGALLAILLSCMMILIISTAIVLMIGGGA